MVGQEAQHKESFTRYEIARILGARALQLSMNAPILLNLSKDQMEELNYDPLKIAEMEFREGVLPITVKRPLPERLERKESEEETELEKEIPEEESAEPKKDLKSVEELSGEVEKERAEEAVEAAD